MVAKLSLMSFIYKQVEVFYFPDEKVKKHFERYMIEGFFSIPRANRYKQHLHNVCFYL